MGDTVSIPEDPTNNSSEQSPRKPSPPHDNVPKKGHTADEEKPDPQLLSPHPPSHPPPAKKSKRCPQCRKEGKKRKLTITNKFNCNKCETDYCVDHISGHDCDFDHHEHHKNLIIKNNPTIHFKKIDKI